MELRAKRLCYLRTSASQLSGGNPQRGHLTSAESEAARAFDFLGGPLVRVLHLDAELRPFGVIGAVATLDGHQVDVVHGAVLAHGDPFGGRAAVGAAVGLLGRVPAVTVILGRTVVVGGSGYLDTGGDRRSALLIPLGASIALAAGDSVLARTLSAGLVANLAGCSYRVAVARLASLFAGDGFSGISVVAFFAVVAMSAGRVVLALEADSARDATRQLEKLHIESASSGVIVALAGHTFVGRVGGGSSPGSVKVKRFAFFAFLAGRIVLAVASHLPRAVHDAFGGVAVAFAAPADGQIRDPDPLKFFLFFLI